MIPRPPGPTLFPYTTLFRSHQAPAGHEQDHSAAHRDRWVDDAAAGGVGFRVALPAAPAPDRGRGGGDAEQECEDSKYESTRCRPRHRASVLRLPATILSRGENPPPGLDRLRGPRGGAQDPRRGPPAARPGARPDEGRGMQGPRRTG